MHTYKQQSDQIFNTTTGILFGLVAVQSKIEVDCYLQSGATGCGNLRTMLNVVMKHYRGSVVFLF